MRMALSAHKFCVHAPGRWPSKDNAFRQLALLALPFQGVLGRCIFTRLLSGKKQAAAAGAQAAQALTRDTVADEIDAVRAEHENVRFQLESYKIEQEPAILGIMLTTCSLFGGCTRRRCK